MLAALLPLLLSFPQDAAPADTTVTTLEIYRSRALNTAFWLDVGLTILNIAVIFVIALLLIRLVDRVTDEWVRATAEMQSTAPARQRALTLSNLIDSAARYIVWGVAFIMILSEIDIDVGALLATAGVVGLAVGFGAQTLVKDVISGLFLLFDDTIHVGDLVRIGDQSGAVETIGVRLIRVRKFDGELLMVPAGEVRIFGNKSMDFARVIVEVGLSYDQDTDAILPVMAEVATAWADERRAILLEDEPQIQALTAFGDSSVTARIVVQVKPGEQFAADRALRLRLKRTFDERGIEIPFPQRTLHVVEGASLPIRSPMPPPQPDADDAPAESEGASD